MNANKTTAVEMRKKGHTWKEIADFLDRSERTVQKWGKGVVLTAEQKIKIYGKTQQCKVCSEISTHKGLCKGHYYRMRRYGDPLGEGEIFRPTKYDLTDKIFGRLTVVKRVQKPGHITKKSGGPWYECRCECGNVSIICSATLKKQTRSCGCLMTEMAGRCRMLALAPSQAGLNRLYNVYKGGAKHRRSGPLLFELDKETFKTLTSSPCHYCGDPPLKKIQSHQKTERSTYYYNGLDRIDSTKGYTKVNVVPCCEICNRMKMASTYVDFFKKIACIYQHRGLNDLLV